MPIFKKQKINSKINSEKTKNSDIELKSNQKIVKKKKIGMGFGKNKSLKLKSVPPNNNITSSNNSKRNKEKINEENIEDDINDIEAVDILLESILETDIEPNIEEKKELETKITKKLKPLMQRDYRNKPVFLEDTGEKLGIIFDMVYDKDKIVVAYKIKDGKSDTVLSFPVDQFDEDKNGLIFISGWSTKAVKTIEKLEFKDRISPELTTLLKDSAISNEELYTIFVKHDDEMANYMDEAASLRASISKRLLLLERQRIAIKENLMDLTERRLIKDIDRREFSEDVMVHRRKVNILDVNIKKCKEIIERLDKTSFGYLIEKDISSSNDLSKEDIEHISRYSSNIDNNHFKVDNELDDLYKQRYLELRDQYDNLQETYNDLKEAVEKIMQK